MKRGERMNKKLVLTLMIIMFSMSTTLYGASVDSLKQSDTVSVSTDKDEEQTKQDTTDSKEQGKQQIVEIQQNQEENMESEKEADILTLRDAVDYGLAHSVVLEKVENQAAITKLVKDNAPDTRDALIDHSNDLESAAYLIEDGRDTIYDSAAQLDSAQVAFENGVAPIDIPVEQLGITIPKGQNIEEYIHNVCQAAGLDSSIESALIQGVMEGVEEELDKKSETLVASRKELEESTATYLASQSKYDAALQYAMANVASKLSTSTISSLDPKPLGDLVVKMANIQDEVTGYAINIYRNQVALLIQNSYYEALKEQQLLEVKKKATQRGKLQYELAQAAYDVGAKSKDDMIIAKTYYDSTVMSEELQRKDYNAALIELKTNMNMDLSKEIKLEEVEIGTEATYELAKGIESGKKARLEVKTANAHKDLYEALLDAVKQSNYTSSDNQYKEVELLQEYADIELKTALLEVEKDIRTSYSTMTSMQKIAQKAEELEAGALETLEIAKVKYEVGFGYDNALLSSLNLESMSGTMVEVLAAEENLVTIQEKKIEAINGYNLATLKYLNDIGVLPY